MQALGRVITLLALYFLLAPAWATEMRPVRVHDVDGNPIPDAVVYVDAFLPEELLPPGQVVVDQVNKQFQPRVSVVRVGTDVVFPNSDTVSHHVYSFANPNNFELPLYKGQSHPAVRFDHPGLVTLGCNIHDSMIGYILVVETPHFAVTDAKGEAMLTGARPLPEGASIFVWSPELGSSEAIRAIRSNSNWLDDGQTTLELMIGVSTASSPDDSDGSLSWDDY